MGWSVGGTERIVASGVRVCSSLLLFYSTWFASASTFHVQPRVVGVGWLFWSPPPGDR